MADEYKSFEGIYWSKFKEVQFLQHLSENPGDGLRLPMTFVKNVREKLGESVTLKTTSEREWLVELKTVAEGSLSLKGAGWKEFVSAHQLRKGDTLVFKYYGNSKFDITMFNVKTNCENLCSYILTKEASPLIIEKERARKVASAVVKNQLFSSHKKDSNYSKGNTSRKRLIKISSDEEDSGDHDDSLSSKGKKISKDTTMSNFWMTDDELQPKPKGRVLLTEEERHRTWIRAEKENKDDGFVVRMRPSYVHPRYSLALSAEWARRSHQGLNKSQEVELRVNGKSWIAKFNSGSVSGSIKVAAWLFAGWKAFVVDNGVEEGDACLFNVVPGSIRPIAFNIRIFRAADDNGEGLE